MWGILAAIAVLRRLQHWLRYLLRLLRLRRYSDREDAWDEVSLQQESSIRLAQVGQTPPVGNSRYVLIGVCSVLAVLICVLYIGCYQN